MAAGEDQLQPLIADAQIIHVRWLLELRHFQLTGLLGQGPLATDAIDRTVTRSRHQPRARIVRPSILGPAFGGGDERFLHGLLSELEVTEIPDERRQDAAPFLTEDLLKLGVHRGGHCEASAT